MYTNYKAWWQKLKPSRDCSAHPHSSAWSEAGDILLDTEWRRSACWGWGGCTLPSSPSLASSPTSCSGEFTTRTKFTFWFDLWRFFSGSTLPMLSSIWPSRFYNNSFSYESVQWSHKNNFRPTNDSPVVAWSLDQKESLKSAFFIGYVIMQVWQVNNSKHLCHWFSFPRFQGVV